MITFPIKLWLSPDDVPIFDEPQTFNTDPSNNKFSSAFAPYGVPSDVKTLLSKAFDTVMPGP